MSKSNNEKQQIPRTMEPTAPLPAGAYHPQYAERAPPPSYEESQKSYGVPPVQPSQYTLTRPAPPQYFSAVQQTATSISSQSYYPNYNTQPMQQHLYQPLVAPQGGMSASISSVAGAPHVLTLAKGAEVRYTSTGNMSIPPPPPGCAPTAAQLAAMQGQPVVLQKKKRSFF